MELSTCEATVYLSMTYIIFGTVTEISSNSNVPKTKIYNILKSLTVKRFVEIERYKLLKYNIMPPSDVFRHYKQKIMDGIRKN